MKDYQNTKLYIGPMSQNVIDSVIQFSNNNNISLGLIPSRRQIENSGGYVNRLSTRDFCSYVKRYGHNVIIARDHGGPMQGSVEDDGLESFSIDCECMDTIHIDPWIGCNNNYNNGLIMTIKLINFCHELNPNICFEVGTEQSIYKMEPTLVDKFITDLKCGLKESIISKIIYVVIQSGTALKDGKNVGSFDERRLSDMVSVCHRHGFLSKEHNGDFLPLEQVRRKFELGLDAINIAPEFGCSETEYILKRIDGDQKLIEDFYNVCYESGKWRKWVNSSFVPENNKLELIRICGHYVFSNPKVKEIKSNFENIDLQINKILQRKISLLLDAIQLR